MMLIVSEILEYYVLQQFETAEKYPNFRINFTFTNFA